MKTILKKYRVCSECLSVGIIYADCICAHQNNYPTIELEFDMCPCCGNLISDGNPADTEFNKQQFKKLNNET